MSNLQRRSFLLSLLCVPAMPIVGDFSFKAQEEPKVTRKTLTAEVETLALKAARRNFTPVYSVLIMLRGALVRSDEMNFASHCAKYDFTESEADK